MRALSIDEENIMLKTTVECYKNKALTFEESTLFLTTHINTKQRMIRGETLIKRKFANRVVNNKEGPHRKWSAATLCGKTGQSHFESTDCLLIKKKQKSCLDLTVTIVCVNIHCFGWPSQHYFAP